MAEDGEDSSSSSYHISLPTIPLAAVGTRGIDYDTQQPRQAHPTTAAASDHPTAAAVAAALEDRSAAIDATRTTAAGMIR